MRWLEEKNEQTKRFGEIGTHGCMIWSLMVKNDVGADSCLEEKRESG
jgi:hypothetical protein